METSINIYLPISELWFLLALVPLLVILLFVKKIREKPFAYAGIFGAIIIICFIAYGSYKNSITLKDNQLTVYAGGFSKTFSTAYACIKVANFSANSNYQLSYRSAGTAMADYRAGYFKNTNGKDVFVLITGQAESASQYQFEEGMLLVEDSPAVLSLMNKICE